MYCKHSGKEIADDSNFCNYCGKELSSIKKERKARITHIIVLVLVAILAVALTVGVIYLLWFEFHDFEWYDGLLGKILSLFIGLLWLINPVNCLAYGLCLGAWASIFTLHEQFFDNNKPIKNHSYTGVDEYHSNSVKNDIDDAISASYNKDYSYEDFADYDDDKYPDL